MMRKPSCLISCSHWLPEGSLSVLVGRHGAMNPAGKVRCNIMPIARDYSRTSQSFLFARLTRTKQDFICRTLGSADKVGGYHENSAHSRIVNNCRCRPCCRSCRLRPVVYGGPANGKERNDALRDALHFPAVDEHRYSRPWNSY